jgi:hypothetical protein
MQSGEVAPSKSYVYSDRRASFGGSADRAKSIGVVEIQALSVGEFVERDNPPFSLSRQSENDLASPSARFSRVRSVIRASTAVGTAVALYERANGSIHAPTGADLLLASMARPVRPKLPLLSRNENF